MSPQEMPSTARGTSQMEESKMTHPEPLLKNKWMGKQRLRYTHIHTQPIPTLSQKNASVCSSAWSLPTFGQRASFSVSKKPKPNQTKTKPNTQSENWEITFSVAKLIVMPSSSSCLNSLLFQQDNFLDLLGSPIL